MADKVTLNLEKFYPSDVEILSIEEERNKIIIQMRSSSKSCKCIHCGLESSYTHGSHHRIVQDLPILGKQVLLSLQIKEYVCHNDACNSKIFTETLQEFVNYKSRMTLRLEQFLCSLAIETSCEAAARIMKTLNVKISGDTIIRLLKRRYGMQEAPKCSSVIGVDDFAFKKRNTYGTIVVDQESHKIVAILDGRDGKTLKEWLHDNQHITTITRDRASAYSKAIDEALPGCIEIADRFHLHQNLLEAIKKIINREIPQAIAIEKERKEDTEKSISEKDILEDKSTEDEEKRLCFSEENYTLAERKRLEFIQMIQKLLEKKISRREIARVLNVDKNTVNKYATGDPYILCRSNKRSRLDRYKNFIIQEIEQKTKVSDIIKHIIAIDHSLKKATVKAYIYSVVKEYHLKTVRTSDYIVTDNKKKSECDFITRKGIFNHLWMDIRLSEYHKMILWKKYPLLRELEKCIFRFREMFRKKHLTLLYLFIERYQQSTIKEIASFANNLSKDLEAIENAVSSDYSNGLVEGTNNKLKTVKRTMYGRCGKELLEAKLMYNI